jgi:hypothetical protein
MCSNYSICFEPNLRFLNVFRLLYLCSEIILTVSAFSDWLFDFMHFLQSLL